MADVVYILKNNVASDELRYSLRSLKNFVPHERVWFVGGMPKDMTPDAAMTFEQIGTNNWERVRYSLEKLCANDDISADFWLFNDDFFIMKPMKSLSYMYRGTLQERADGIERRRGSASRHALSLLDCAAELEEKGHDTRDYALHVPMLINREKALLTLDEFDSPMFRSLYGNHHKVGGVKRADVKIQKLNEEPPANARMLSTSNTSFRHGLVGKRIRMSLMAPCKYEK